MKHYKIHIRVQRIRFVGGTRFQRWAARLLLNASAPFQLFRIISAQMREQETP